MMKRIATLTLCAILLFCLCACAANGKQAKLGQADNEILTYQKIDPEKTTLFVGTTGNDYIGHLNAEFESQNPDVQIIVSTQTGGSGTSRPMADNVKSGYAPDIMFVSAGYFDSEETVQYFEKLSANPLVRSYQDEALNRLAVDDNIYFLPGPSTITCMLYNNTLFEQYGWETPKTFEEFVALCLRIREDTNGTVQPWNPNAKYETNFNAVTTAFVYEELFGGIENRSWYEEFINGNATFAGHMEPYYDMLQTLIDNDIILEEHFSYSATTRGEEFQEGKIAMYNYPVGGTRSEVYDIRYMPFPSTTGENGFLVDNINVTVGVPIKEHTEAEKDAIQRYLEFFTSIEGQNAFIGENLMFSNVKDVPLNNAEYLSGIEDAINKGRYFSQLTFALPDVKSNISFSKDALAMTLGEKTGAQCIADNDVHPFKTEEVQEPEPVATVAEDFTILDTSFFIADMYREKAGADIGLIAHNVAYRGNLMRMYKGELDADDIKSLKPRSLENKSTLIKATMSGRQFMEAITHITNYGDTDVNAVFAFSGLKCTVAPWKPRGEVYASVALADGTAIDPDTLYTVAMWDGTVAPEYITEIVETYAGTWEEFMTETLKAKGTIAPARDGRITLVWE
ncbi:MAG: extracellular solute-binding protein [Clostridia bacterium]|nr:extracellular solute-binding protein [Clostridia bacterium]